MRRRKKRKSRNKKRTTEKASMDLPGPEKSDLAWMLMKYRKTLQEDPGQTLFDFLMSCGVSGLMPRLWCSASHLFCAPEKYTCVWHGTSLNRAIRILERGFRTPTYTSLEPEVCMDYAERRSGPESDLPALIACILEQLYVQKRTDVMLSGSGHLVFQAFPNSFTQFVLIPPEKEPFFRLSPLETWRIYTHTPGLVPPSQIELDTLLDEWDFTDHVASGYGKATE